MATDFLKVIKDNNLPPIPDNELIINMRYIMARDNWYLETNKSWYFLLRGEWVKSKYGP